MNDATPETPLTQDDYLPEEIRAIRLKVGNQLNAIRRRVDGGDIQQDDLVWLLCMTDFYRGEMYRLCDTAVLSISQEQAITGGL